MLTSHYQQRLPDQPVPELMPKPAVVGIYDPLPAADQGLVTDVDERVRLDRRTAVRRYERDAIGAEVIEVFSRSVWASVPVTSSDLGECLRVPDSVPLGIDLGQRPEQMLDDLLSLRIGERRPSSPRRHGLKAAHRRDHPRGSPGD